MELREILAVFLLSVTLIISIAGMVYTVLVPVMDTKVKPTVVCEQLKPYVTRCEYTYEN